MEVRLWLSLLSQRAMNSYMQALKQSSQRILAAVLRQSCLGVSWEEARKTQESWELELGNLESSLSMARPSP